MLWFIPLKSVVKSFVSLRNVLGKFLHILRIEGHPATIAPRTEYLMKKSNFFEFFLFIQFCATLVARRYMKLIGETEKCSKTIYKTFGAQKNSWKTSLESQNCKRHHLYYI